MRVPGRVGSAVNRHGLAGAIEELLSPRAAPARAMITQTGPHLRDGMNLPTLRLCIVIALAPCVLISFYNTGHQAGLGPGGAIAHRPGVEDSDVSEGAFYDPSAVLELTEIRGQGGHLLDRHLEAQHPLVSHVVAEHPGECAGRAWMPALRGLAVDVLTVAGDHVPGLDHESAHVGLLDRPQSEIDG